MTEMARLLQNEKLVHLGRIARITGLSENYLAQLAISLKNHGLLIGISGKKGGYYLGRPPGEITLDEIIKAVAGPIAATDCAAHPEICLNSSCCEARAIWVLISDRIAGLLHEYSLADLIDKDWLKNLRAENSTLEMLNLEINVRNKRIKGLPGCPVVAKDKREENNA